MLLTPVGGNRGTGLTLPVRSNPADRSHLAVATRQWFIEVELIGFAGNGMARRSKAEDPAIGRVLRRLRLDAGMTQEQLGDKIGVSYQQIQKYEVGMNRVALSTCLHLAEALDMLPSEFVAMVEDELDGGNDDTGPTLN